MNFQLVMDKIFRGDFVRMNSVADGYGDARIQPTSPRVFGGQGGGIIRQSWI